MKIKELLDKFDKTRYEKWFELFHQNKSEYYIQTHYLYQVIMYKFLEENDLIINLYEAYNLKELLKDIKLEKEEDINILFGELYDIKHGVRNLLFRYIIKDIKLNSEYNISFSDFIDNWFCKLFLNKSYYLPKKDLNKILNTKI